MSFPKPIAHPKPTHLTPLVLGINHHITWLNRVNGLWICCQLNGQSNLGLSVCWLGGAKCRVTRSALQSIMIVSKQKKKSNHSLTTCSQWQRHVQLRVFLKKKYLICIRNTLNHKIRNTFKLKKKKIWTKIWKKKKIVTKPSPWQAQQITEVANPQILKIKK